MSNQYSYKNCDPLLDHDAITDLLFAIKEELYLPDRETAATITDNLFTNGGVIAAYHHGQLCGTLGYFYGQPQNNFADKETAFLYVGAILPAYRLTRMFHRGLLFALRHFQQAGVQQIRLQAEAANPYTNKLYGRFAHPVAKGKSLRGIPVITYGGAIETAINRLAPRRRAAVAPHTAAMQTAVI